MSRTTHHVPWRHREDAVAAAMHGCRGPLHCGRCRSAFGSAHTRHTMRTLIRRRRRSGETGTAGLFAAADVNEASEVAVEVVRSFAVYKYGRAFGFPFDADGRAAAAASSRRRERDLLKMAARDATTLLAGDVGDSATGDPLGELDGWLPKPRRARW